MNYFIITIVSLLIGWYLGVKSAGEMTLEDINADGKKVFIKLKDKFKKKSDLNPGVIKRPNSLELRRRNESSGTKAVKESLDKFPELKKASDILTRGEAISELFPLG